MKRLDVVSKVLLTVGGLNWGAVGLFDLDLVAALLGEGSVLARIVYTLVGLGAVWTLAQWNAMPRRLAGAEASRSGAHAAAR
jgi:uncharacterized membrane protein YuzA (DUF378 family)